MSPGVFREKVCDAGGNMPPKILIVDDEALIRLLIEQTLEDLEDRGVELLTAENGEKALQVARAEQPDLVFLDVMMPMLDGFAVCRAIKQDQKLRRTFVVLLTAKGQEVDQQLGLQAGADVYMTKPFDPDELFDLAEKVLEL
jgi:two-component system, OmpR family, alkaline phosphatase synthesis response regulator PhoP